MTIYAYTRVQKPKMKPARQIIRLLTLNHN
jgi:hypothetical protein